MAYKNQKKNKKHVRELHKPVKLKRQAEERAEAQSKWLREMKRKIFGN